jgi:predicted metal-binding membrane protein
VSFVPDTLTLTRVTPVERLLRRERVLVVSGLVVLSTLAWIYVLMGAGTGMSVWAMTTLTLFPHLDAAATASMPWSLGYLLLMVAMWWIMMIAMMAPSAAPTALLYVRVYRHHAASAKNHEALAPSGAFIAGYLLVWLAFSIAATVVQWSLEHNALLSVATMGSQSRWLSAAILLAAGVYQFLPLKYACLAHCRAPAAFLSQHWRAHAAGAIRLGVLHGAYCLGCCWVLMAILFVGGVMNVVWIAALTVLVLAEKILDGGPWVSRCVGLVLIVWGIATLVV